MDWGGWSIREFRNWDERNKSIIDVKNKLSLMFGFHKDIYLEDFFHYLNSSDYDEEKCKLSGTEIDFCDMRKIIDFTMFSAHNHSQMFTNILVAWHDIFY